MQNAAQWPLYDQFKAIHLAAGAAVPERAVFGLHEIADEAAAIRLLASIRELCERPDFALSSARRIFEALDNYRNGRDFKARPAVEPIARLKRARETDRSKTMTKLLANPDQANSLMAQLSQASPANGAPLLFLPSEGGASSADHQFLVLARDGQRLDKILDQALANQAGSLKKLDIIRRLQALSLKPTKRRLQRLICDARANGRKSWMALASALRYGARHVAFQDSDRPSRWVASLAQNPPLLGEVAKEAHGFLLKCCDGPGRVREFDLERYSDEIATIYLILTGRQIGYTKGTENSKTRRSGELYGCGLDFMRAALQLIDRSATAFDAKRHIDRIRSRQRRSQE